MFKQLSRQALRGANIDVNYSNSTSLIEQLCNSYERPSCQQEIAEIFSCIIAYDLFSCTPNIIEHWLKIKNALGQDHQGFEFLKEHITEEFVKLYLQEHRVITYIEKYSEFIKTITAVDPDLNSILNPCTEILTEAKMAIGNMSNLLLEILGLSCTDPEILTKSYSKTQESGFVIETNSTLSQFSSQEQELHRKTLEFYEKYPECTEHSKFLQTILTQKELQQQLVNLHGFTPVVSSRLNSRVQAALAPNLLSLVARYIS